MTNNAVGIVGLGYVGLPLAVEFCRQRFDVYGVDKSKEKIELLQNGETYIGDVSEAALKDCLETGRFHVSTNYNDLTEVQAISVCVPTPLRKTKDPDMSYVVDAAENIAEILQPEQDCVIVVTDHSDYDWEFIAQHARLIFDTRNATKGTRDKQANIQLL